MRFQWGELSKRGQTQMSLDIFHIAAENVQTNILSLIHDPLLLIMHSKLSRLKYSVNSINKNIVQVPRLRLGTVQYFDKWTDLVLYPII